MGSLEQEVNQLHSELCAGLADPKRILILYALSQGPLNVSEIAEKLDLPQPTTSRHLKLLKERNLVIAAREGTSVYYTLADQRVIQALDLLRTVLADHLHMRATLAASASSRLAEEKEQRT
jgi:DNA-binding transcriptional ArsR family regulator